MSITLGVVSPGAMGSALAERWRAGGARVSATLSGRSDRTRALARAAGVDELADLDAVVAASDVVVSVTPPDAAERVAEDVMAAAVRGGSRPRYADLNAIAPVTVARVAARVAAAGLEMIDGAISGPPPRAGGRTDLYLSGPDLDVLADIQTDGLVVHVVGPTLGQASAVKMCTASIY